MCVSCVAYTCMLLLCKHCSRSRDPPCVHMCTLITPRASHQIMLFIEDATGIAQDMGGAVVPPLLRSQVQELEDRGRIMA